MLNTSFVALLALVTRAMALSSEGPPPYDRRYWPPALNAGAATPPRPPTRNPISSLARAARSLVSPRDNNIQLVSEPVLPYLIPNLSAPVDSGTLIPDEMRDILLETQAEVKQARMWAQQEVAAAYAEAQRQMTARRYAEQEWAYVEAEAKAVATQVVEASAQVQVLTRELKAAHALNHNRSALEEKLVQETSNVALLKAEIKEIKSDAALQIAAGLADALSFAKQEVAAVESEAYSASAKAAEASAKALKLQRELDVIKRLNTTAAGQTKDGAAGERVVELQVEVKALKEEMGAQAQAASENVALIQMTTAASLRELEASFAAAQKREMELRVSLSAATHDSSVVNARVLILQKELDVAKAAAAEEAAVSEVQREKLANLFIQVEELNKEVATSASSRAEDEAGAAAMAKAATEAAEALARAEKSATSAEANSKAATARATEASAQVTQLQRELDAALTNAAKATATSVANETRTLEAEVAAGAAKAAKLQIEVDALKEEIVSEALDAASAKTAADEAVLSLKASLRPLMDAQSAMAATLGAQAQELEAALAEAQEREAKVHESWAALQRDNEVATFRMTALQKKLTAAQGVSVVATAKFDAIRQKLASTESAFSTLQEQLEVETLKNAAYDDTVASLQTQLSAHINKSEAAERDLSTLQAQLEVQVRKNTAADDAVFSLQAQLAAQIDKNEAAESAASSLHAQLTARALMEDATAEVHPANPLGDRARKLEESLIAAFVQKQDLQKSLAAMSGGTNEEAQARVRALRLEFDVTDAKAAKANAKSNELRERLFIMKEVVEQQTEQLASHEAARAANAARFPSTAAGQAVAKAAAAKAAADLTLVRARVKQEFAKAESESKAADAWAAEVSSKTFKLQRDLNAAQTALLGTSTVTTVARSAVEAQVTEAEKIVERLQAEVEDLKKDLSAQAAAREAAIELTERIQTRGLFRRRPIQQVVVEDLNKDLSAQAAASEAAITLAESVRTRDSIRRRPLQQVALEVKKPHTPAWKRRSVVVWMGRLAVLALLSSLGVISIFDVTFD
jgi:hypothetical protein